MAIQGDLSDVSLASLIQVMCLKGKDVRIELSSAHRTGALVLAAGEVVDASTDMLRGEDAVYELLSWEEASFQVISQPGMVTKTIHASWNQLVMEAMQRLDEGKHQEELEDAFVALVSNLEQIQIRLKDPATYHRPQRALRLFTQWVNQTVGFYESREEFEGRALSLGGVIAKVGQTHPAAKFLQPAGGRLPVEHLESLYTSQQNGSPRPPLAQLYGALLEIEHHYLELLLGAFRQADPRKSWSETCRYLVEELRATLSGLSTANDVSQEPPP